jgi:hypothetical protein
MGVNSTALMLLLEDAGEKFENVFVDCGCDYPETYKYLDYLQSKGYDITIITPEVSGCHTIEEYALKYHFFPGFHSRWCTRLFKIKPILKYYQKPCIEYIGFDVQESKRYNRQKSDDGIFKKYPLMEKNIDRDQCKKIIISHNLNVPPRSRCWCCPFMTDKEVRNLFLENRELYEKRAHFEEEIMGYKDKAKKQYFLSIKQKSVRKQAMESIPPLSSYSQH